jgi:plastocyanin
MNKKILIWVIIIVIILVAIYLLIPKSANQQPNVNTVQNQTQNTQATSVQATTTVKTTPENTVPAKKHAVSIVNFSFDPAVLTINKGDTVVWANNDSAPHQIASANFNGPVMSNGDGYSSTFNNTGTFDYHCAIHPSMKGTIVVQ